MAKPIFESLRHISGGTFLDEAAEKMAELVHAVDSTRKAGKITLVISLRQATAGAMAISGQIKLSAPKEPATEALMFPTPEGNLLVEDPRQQKLPLKAVPAQDQALKTIGAE